MSFSIASICVHVCTISMKIADLPEYAKKYKKKGFDVKKKDNTYYLYEITHIKKPNKKYLTTKYVYVGKITESGDLIKAHAESDKPQRYLEYGLSSYIYSFHRRTLQRSLFNITGETADTLIMLGIIQYVFGIISEEIISSSYLTYAQATHLFNFYNSSKLNHRQVTTISNRIETLLEEKIPSKEKREVFIVSLRSMPAIYFNEKKIKLYSVYSSFSEEIAREFKFKL